MAGLGERAAKPFHFIDADLRAGDDFAIGGAVRRNPRRRKTERAGIERFADQRRHLRDFLRRGLFVVAAAFAHHIRAHGGVRDLRTDIHRKRFFRQRVEVFGIGFPFPRDAFGQRGAGDVLHAFHDVDQAIVKIGFDRGKAHAAIAHDDRGHAVPARGRKERVPADLAIVVGVNVDPARRDQQASGIDFTGSSARHHADCGDHVAVDRYIGHPARRASAIDHGSIADYDIMHDGPSSSDAIRLAG